MLAFFVISRSLQMSPASQSVLRGCVDVNEELKAWSRLERKLKISLKQKSLVKQRVTGLKKHEKTIFNQSSTHSFFVFDRSNHAANANEMLIAIAAPIQTIPSSIDIDQSINNSYRAQKH